MTDRSTRRLRLLVAAAGLAAACQARVSSFSVISTRPIPWKPEVVGRGVGEDSGHQLLNSPVPFVSNPSGYPSDPWAVDQAIEIAGGNLLLDADLHWSLWNVWYYGEWTTTAQGVVARVTATRPAAPTQVSARAD